VNVVITGATGQVGRALEATAPETAHLTMVGRTCCDFTCAAAIDALVERLHADLVINAAAYTAVDAAESDQQTAAAVNAGAVAHLARRTAALGTRFIQISTDFVFDGRSGAAYKTDAKPNPLSVYGETKRNGEVAALAANPEALVVRTAWVYAAQGRNFVRTMLNLMAERDRAAIVSDQVGTPTSARSLAAALWALADQKATGLHHYTDSGVASWFDFAVAIQEDACDLGLLARRIPLEPIPASAYPTPARRPQFSVLNCYDTWRTTGTPPHWRQQLRKTLQEMRDYG